jgi:prolipoprotein diacylglyceryl transferase
VVTWNVNPEIFNINIFGFDLAPRYYGLAFVLGFFLGEKYVGSYMKKNGYTSEDVSKLFTNMLLGCIIGARLGHCLFYEPGYYLSNPILIFKVWEGGLASHGGFIGVMFGVWLFNRKATKKLDYIWLLDLVAAPSLITGAYIRIGNLMNSEILGTPSDAPWAFVFKRIDNIPRHPAQLYESLGYFTISMIVFHLYKKFHETWPKGRFVGLILVGGMGWRFFTEFFKENQVAFEDGMFINMGQLLSIMMLAVGAYLIFRKLPNK